MLRECFKLYAGIVCVETTFSNTHFLSYCKMLNNAKNFKNNSDLKQA